MKDKKTFINYQFSLLFYGICLCFQIIAIILHSMIFTMVSMILYIVFSIGTNKKEYRPEFFLKKIENSKIIWWYLFEILMITSVFFNIQYFFFGFSNQNFFVTVAHSQQQYGVITSQNKWFYFPIALIGFGTLPFVEDLFFRGQLLKSFELRVSPLKSNIIQAFLFSIIHTTYFLTIEVNFDILIPMLIWVFIAGYLYGAITQKTKSLYASIIIHLSNDMFMILIVYIFII